MARDCRSETTSFQIHDYRASPDDGGARLVYAVAAGLSVRVAISKVKEERRILMTATVVCAQPFSADPIARCCRRNNGATVYGIGKLEMKLIKGIR